MGVSLDGAGVAALDGVVPADRILPADRIEDYSHDEALGSTWTTPLAVVQPTSTDEVAAVLRAANASGTPVTARGSGTGLSGAEPDFGDAG